MASSLARNVARVPFLLALALIPLASLSVPSCSTRKGVCGDARVDTYTDDQKKADPTLVDEECDDGNTVDTDNCTNSCKLPKCGDGILQAATNNEQCEDTDWGAADRCPQPCAAPKVCKLLPTPTCVDAPAKSDATDTDGCTIVCKNNVLNDGYLYQGVEECDDGNLSNNDACLVTCLKATCGDGFVHSDASDPGDDPKNLEECDDGNDVNTDLCTTKCKNAVCGDGYVLAGVEQCDDGNKNDNDTCPSTCKLPTCGDGFVDPETEECDDGNQDATDACLPTCKKAKCGDGFVEAGVEECDDGNQVSGDYCSPTCKKECFGDNAGLYMGHCYMFYPGPTPWAQANCNAFDAHLVTIESTGENTFVQGLLPADATDAWIGLTDQQVESAWFWQLDQQGMKLLFPAILKWAPGQPDNKPTPANCAIIDRSTGLWADQGCAETRGFVCEHDY
jgi:cysteine-rich repeat protein